MKAKERKAIRTISEAFQVLPDIKKEYLIGYAEGVVAAKKQEEAAENEEREKIQKPAS